MVTKWNEIESEFYCEDLDENLGPADTCYFDPCPHKTHCMVYKLPEATAMD